VLRITVENLMRRVNQLEAIPVPRGLGGTDRERKS